MISACPNFGLTVNIKKTEVFYQPAQYHSYVEPSATTNGKILNVMDKFTYCGSILSSDVHIDDEVGTHTNTHTLTLPELVQCLGGSQWKV